MNGAMGARAGGQLGASGPPPTRRNRDVVLHAEADRQLRPMYELSPLHIVRWVQCPRCRARFWYALNSETSPEELWHHGTVFRQQLLGEPCAAHPGAAEASGAPAAAMAGADPSAGAAVLGVRVELFGVARLTAGARALVLAHTAAGTLADVVGALGTRYPALLGPVIAADGRTLLDGYAFNVNGRDFVLDLEAPLQPGDTVLLVAAAGGG